MKSGQNEKYRQVVTMKSFQNETLSKMKVVKMERG